MDTERWRRLRGILDVALNAAEGDRPDILRAQAGGDEELRALAERMLGEDTRPGAWMDVPHLRALGGLWGGERKESLAGRSIGPYRLERSLGAGGMGLSCSPFRPSPAELIARAGVAQW